MARDVTIRPAGCTCGYAQIHEAMPWQRVHKDPDCPAHPVYVSDD